jgi:hypothetical protein
MFSVGRRFLVNQSLLGEIDLGGLPFGPQAHEFLAEPIRNWFHGNPEEKNSAGYYSAHFERQRDGRYLCKLEVVGQTRWLAEEAGVSMPQALKRSLENLTPATDLYELEGKEGP